MMEYSEANRFEQFLKRNRKYFKALNYALVMLASAVILGTLLELTSYGIYQLYHFSDPRIDMDAYQDKEFAKEYYREFEDTYITEYFPYVGYIRIPNFRGKYINIDHQSIRKTNRHEFPGEKTKIFVFGGSTVWGTGARDEKTIPSLIADYLHNNQIASEVTNFGESGYTNSQGMIRLLLELRKGNYPDIAIFYDGVNDVFSAYQSRIAGMPQNIDNRKADFNSRDKLNLLRSMTYFRMILMKPFEIYHELYGTNVIPEDLRHETSKVYTANIQVIKALEDRFGFKSLFFWQPTVYTKAVLSEDEKHKFKRSLAEGTFYKIITSDISKNREVKDLSKIFNGYEHTIFIDPYHLSEEGNGIIAERIGKDIVQYLISH